ncbi:MAG: MutS family DNA mismatch repair protein [Thomasclavelia sp.]|uniref:MutS family DNA mismatch repair protein n=1 Tax=Thomasclavelia sp. TaxID=3025757 RepID=UPI0039A21CF3
MECNDYLLFQNKLIKEIKDLESSSLKISVFRFIAGTLILVFLLSGYFLKLEYIYLFMIIAIIIFILLVFKHTKITDQLTYLKAKSKVIENYLARFDNKWKEFEETGLDYIEQITGVMKDLDIVGNNSLFQYLNTANTLRGKKRLLSKLTRNEFDHDLLIQEQIAVKELGERNDFVINIETYGKMLLKPKMIEKVIEEFIVNIYTKQRWKKWKLVRYIIPILTIIALIMFLFDYIFKLAVILLPVLIFGQWIIAIINLNKNSELFKQITQISKCLTSYQNICELIEKTTFRSVHINNLKNSLLESSQAFCELKAISSSVKQRNNLLAALLLNGILLWDINCRERYELWVDKYGEHVNDWLDNIAELESLISLQVLLQTKHSTTFATFTNELCLEFNQAYHPLINEKQVVSNSFTMKKQVCVITGSNMSGKTTFLRTIGTNLVLAYAGGPVLADSFKCSLMKIFTSMRLEDDISGISTFYAELLRIKEIVEANQQGERMIALIDEIFKGTNSKDRIYGATETVKQLSTSNIFTFITTHDFELCELENQVPCINYHFSEYYENNKIKFDYLIKQGRCKTTNAKYLLKMVGIVK